MQILPVKDFHTAKKATMQGCMFQFSARDKNLLAFISLNSDKQPCRNAVVFIAGQTDGFLSLNYTPFLSENLLRFDYSLVQVNLSSSFLQFGFGSLQTDSKELTELVKAIKKTYQFRKIVFMGHSTGKYSRVTLYYAYGNCLRLINFTKRGQQPTVSSTWE